jgi:hypothetical protein
MGPPGGPAFGAGIGQAMEQQDKSPVDIAVSTCEKILMGLPDPDFRAAATKFIAQLKVAAAQVAQKGPQSSPMGKPPQTGAGGPPQVPVPPMPGQMPG